MCVCVVFTTLHERDKDEKDALRPPGGDLLLSTVHHTSSLDHPMSEQRPRVISICVLRSGTYLKRKQKSARLRLFRGWLLALAQESTVWAPGGSFEARYE